MSVRIRMKKMGRAHRHFFRVCAMDKRRPRNGKVLEELGTYDPMLAETDARAQLKNDRIDYWLGVGAQPSEKVAVLIKKYGTNGTHAESQREALERLAMGKEIPDAGEPASIPEAEETAPEAESQEQPSKEATTNGLSAPQETESQEAVATEQPSEPGGGEKAVEEPEKKPEEG